MPTLTITPTTPDTLQVTPVNANSRTSEASSNKASGSVSGKTTAHPSESTQLMEQGYNFAFLDEQTKRMVRRATLKAVAIPGYQVPFASREMPMPYGWGTGGIQITASVIGQDDTLKVIDQGADDTTNAVSIRSFFCRTTGVATTEETADATLIQTRHRIPELPLTHDQILIYQVPIPEALRWMEPRETETRKMHAHEEYGVMHVKLYEDIARHGHIATSFDYPVMVADRYIASPSPIPKFDNPKMNDCPALQLFGAGREQRIYAIPPYTTVKSLDFEDHPFTVQSWDDVCGLCGAADSYLDEIILDNEGSRMFVCSDSDYCGKRQAAGHIGAMGVAPTNLPNASDSQSIDGLTADAPSAGRFSTGKLSTGSANQSADNQLHQHSLTQKEADNG